MITERQNRASKNVFPSFSIRTAATIATTSLLLLSCKKPTETNSQAAATGSAPVDYSSRIGVAVRTASRTCMAIKNDAVQGDSPVTLVLPVSPQKFLEARISGPAASPCPITKEAAPETSNYEISLPASPSIPELIPMIAVAGTVAASTFFLENVSVQADLDQTRTKNTFRACGADDGIHLTVWRGIPVTGTRVWSGYYYEAGNPGTLPTCVAAELAPAAGAHF
jgi:hypothetical protein